MARRNRSISVGIALAVFCVPLAGCGDEQQRNYALPESFCGLDLSVKKYAPVFAPGERIEAEYNRRWGDREERSSQGCRYFVDGNIAVDVSGDWRRSDEKALPADPMAALARYSGADPRPYPGRFGAATRRGGAAAVLKCSPAKSGGPDRFHLDISVNAYKFAQDWDEAREPLGKLVQAAMAKVEARLPCKGKKPPA
ncbi:hypothetical protein OIE63_31605 [Streptomyces sp. NBC_01795]|uniref:hypothetical protein n=1 Tax=unclassified Streptomyces TaxID=2593676 RepID=UPI002DDA56AF|nr:MULTISPECIES: hypothetical protein [unclassified Streptomyces]WSA95604.1 hypothetical protein OIE63_31605 [Streptomyces sp. NBC_01795]WSB80022.1 hypothetical protein OHB04_32725 [Streptomyces sp. NBC_01775]WSS11771.1 hypothetical protein OG533_07490 [Streptomyces sp. NBC_01186]